MLRHLLVAGAFLLPVAPVLAQGSAARCVIDPLFVGCQAPALSPVRSNILAGSQGDYVRQFTLDQVLKLLTSSDVTTALGLTPVSAAQAAAVAPVQSVAGLTGAPTASQISAAMGLGTASTQASTAFYSASNPSGFVTSSQAAAAAPVQSVAGLTGAPTASQLSTAMSLGTASTQATATFYLASNPNGFVTSAQAAAAAPVQSVAGLTGAPTAAQLRTAQGLATVATSGSYPDLASRPTLGGAAALNVGTVAGTVAAGDDTRITGALAASTAASTYAPLVSPALTGTPTAPTAAAGTSTTQVASTAFAQALALETGAGATTRSRTGLACFANGLFPNSAVGQICEAVMRVSTASTAAVRLTSDGAAAGATNCINLPASSAMRLRVEVLAVDTTAPGSNAAIARWDDLLLLRGAAASTTALAGNGTVAQYGAGTMAGTAVAYGLGADTTNGCLILQVTPVNANTTHWIARVTTVEGQ